MLPQPRPRPAATASPAQMPVPDSVLRPKQQPGNDLDYTQLRPECCGRLSRSSPEWQFVSCKWRLVLREPAGKAMPISLNAKLHSTTALEPRRAEHQLCQACLRDPAEYFPSLSHLRLV